MNTQATTNALTPPHDRILRPRELASQVGLSLATLWRLRRRGELPEPIRLSPGCVGWRASVVDKWLATRADARTAEERAHTFQDSAGGQRVGIGTAHELPPHRVGPTNRVNQNG